MAAAAACLRRRLGCYGGGTLHSRFDYMAAAAAVTADLK
jgi:hypothetical protein